MHCAPGLGMARLPASLIRRLTASAVEVKQAKAYPWNEKNMEPNT